MKPWRICRPEVADLHHFDVEQDLDQDPDQHQYENSGPGPHQGEKRIRVRIKVMRIPANLLQLSFPICLYLLSLYCS